MIRDITREYDEGLDKAALQADLRAEHYAKARRRFKAFTFPLCALGIVLTSWGSYQAGSFAACPIVAVAAP